MLYFENDYSEGACKEVIQALIDSNEEKLSGYGSDKYSILAKEKIKKACDIDGDVYFISGGTQTNQIIIDTLLANYQGVIALDTGHVSTHEAGAIEYTGHKVLTIKHHNGKLDSNDLKEYLETFYDDGNHEHMVYPGMVYISHPSEYGTLYTKTELSNIYKVCKQYKIPLYIDGARLGYGLAVNNTDLNLKTIARLCDVFYIGGTKVGALCGEAVVFTKQTPSHFITQVKQHGALLAKGRLLGVQFNTLFTDDLYLKISKQAIDMSELLKQGLKDKGYRFYLESPTNQQFIIISNKEYETLSKKVKMSFWQKYDENHTVVRFACSWATSKEDIENLMSIL